MSTKQEQHLDINIEQRRRTVERISGFLLLANRRFHFISFHFATNQALHSKTHLDLFLAETFRSQQFLYFQISDEPVVVGNNWNRRRIKCSRPFRPVPRRQWRRKFHVLNRVIGITCALFQLCRCNREPRCWDNRCTAVSGRQRKGIQPIAWVQHRQQNSSQRRCDLMLHPLTAFNFESKKTGELVGKKDIIRLEHFFVGCLCE